MYYIIFLQFKQYTSGRFPVVVKNIKKNNLKNKNKTHVQKTNKKQQQN